MHRAPGFRSRNATLMYMFVVPLAVLVGLGLIFGRSLLGTSSPQAAALASTSLTTTPAATAAAPAAPAPASGSAAKPVLKNLGTAKGTFTLKGPRTAITGSYVVFVLDGRKRLIRSDATAPFAVRINTRALPNGTYTVTLLSVRQGQKSVVSTGTLKIKNLAPKPKPKPAPIATPTPGPGSGGGSGGSGGSGGGAGTNTGFAAEVLSLTNVQRGKVGCKPLAFNIHLANAAQGHSADMAKNNYFDHNSQDGTNPFQRMTAAGYKWSAAAENIAAGQQTPADVMNAWMNSPGHKANILNCTYVDLGVGYAKDSKGTPYWTQDFGKPL